MLLNHTGGIDRKYFPHAAPDAERIEDVSPLIGRQSQIHTPGAPAVPLRPMGMKRRSAILAVMLIPAIAVGAAQMQLRPGEYEIALEIDRTVSRGAHFDAGFHKEKRVDCFTSDQLKGPAEIAKLFTTDAEGADCKTSDVKTTGNTMTVTTACQDRGVRTAFNTELTFGTDLIVILTKVRDDRGAASTIRITAKRVGDCKTP